jgi:hypothetical protein
MAQYILHWESGKRDFERVESFGQLLRCLRVPHIFDEILHRLPGRLLLSLPRSDNKNSCTKERILKGVSLTKPPVA